MVFRFQEPQTCKYHRNGIMGFAGVPAHSKRFQNRNYSPWYLYIHAGKYVALDLVLNDKIGYCVYAHPATIIHDDSIIYTSGNIPDVRYKYRFGDMTFDKLSKLIWGKMYNRNLFFFSDNSTGALVESYVSLCKKLIKK